MVTVEIIKAQAEKWPPYGELGILAYDPIDDKVQCHICGHWFRSLGPHVQKAHGWTADDYREEFGLDRGQGLICEGTRQRLRDLNKELGNWKHLSSQTMTKAELSEFLRSIKAKRSFKLRQQACLLKSELLTEYNPMNEPKAQERALVKLRQSWYGSDRMRDIARNNLLSIIARLRERNLRERRWACPCGEAFPCKKAAEHHRKRCPIAREKKIEKAIKARKLWWESLPPEKRELHRQHVSEGKKWQYALSRAQQ